MKLNNFWNKELLRNADGLGGGNPPTEPAPVDLSFIPQDFHTDGKPDLGRFTEHYQSLSAEAAQRAERMAGVPEDGAYDWTIPEGLTFDGLDLPADFGVQLRTDDEQLKPLFADLGATLKDWGIPKSEAGKLMGLLARYDATRFAQAQAASKAEVAKLGTPAQVEARLGLIERALQTKLPAEQVAALKSVAVSADAIRALETLLGPRGGQTATPTPNSSPFRPDMTPNERLAAANALPLPERRVRA